MENINLAGLTEDQNLIRANVLELLDRTLPWPLIRQLDEKGEFPHEAYDALAEAGFMGLFLFFLGFTHAYERYQSPLVLREGLLVAFFLAGLVVLGGQQQWWLQPLLMQMDASSVFYGAAALTTVTDNAAVTYLASLVDGLSDEFKYAVVAGAVRNLLQSCSGPNGTRSSAATSSSIGLIRN